MPTHDLIVIGASLGGVEALQLVIATLAPDLPATICIVWHMSPESPGVLPAMLSKVSPLPVRFVQHNEPIAPGIIYVAPPDYHTLIVDHVFQLSYGPKENRFRPAIDPLFRSAAVAFGPRAVGVILSGALDDGIAGLAAIKAQGGMTIVQDPQEAFEPSMPHHAINQVAIDYIKPAAAIGSLLTSLARTQTAPPSDYQPRWDLVTETQIAQANVDHKYDISQLGELSPYTCPECHGVLFQIMQDGILRFRCHTGHAYSVRTLLDEISKAVEASLWSTIRAMDEKVFLLQHIAQHMDEQASLTMAEQLRNHARAVEQQSQLVRLALLRKPA